VVIIMTVIYTHGSKHVLEKSTFSDRPYSARACIDYGFCERTCALWLTNL
jgi:hypothetical protein